MAVSREHFGDGKAGRDAYSAVVNGAACRALEDGEPCGKPAKGTTDVDAFGDLTILPHCSPVHHRVIVEDVTAQLEAQGHPTVPGRNGWGRA